MSRHIEFHVDRISIDMDLSEAEARRIGPVLKRAFEELARRLQMSPVARLAGTDRLSLGELQVDALSVDDLLGPRGAARLSDIFWQRMIETTRTR
jgi:hypothetical protein